jgi:ribosomal protein S18 acetylase RimI-like enzyme
MIIKKAKKDDLKEISRIFLEETARPPYCQKWNNETALLKTTELFKKGKIYLVITENETAGFIVLIEEMGIKEKGVRIEELWLKKRFQGKGIGTELMRYLELKLKKENVDEISLISNKYSKAFKFYKKLNYIPHTKHVFMTKKLK